MTLIAPDSDGGIRARDITRAYPRGSLWNRLSFESPRGSFTALVGESGSGKTTLLQCVGSLDKPTEGNLQVLGIEPAGLKGSALRRFRRQVVGFLFQNSGLVASWSVQKNVEIGGSRVKCDENRTIKTFDRFGVPVSFLDKPAHDLSGGEQQRVGLIRLALRNPPVMLLDEPTAALDDDNTAKVVEFLTEHCAGGGIAMVATHDERVLRHATHRVSLQPSQVPNNLQVTT